MATQMRFHAALAAALLVALSACSSGGKSVGAGTTGNNDGGTGGIGTGGAGTGGIGTGGSGTAGSPGAAGAGPTDSGASDAPADVQGTGGPFALRSPAFVGFDPDAGAPDAATIPVVDTCAEPDAGVGRPGLSPELDWTAGPAGTMSYVITLVDITISNYHWAVWDIPATTLSLPQGLPKGQTLTVDAGAPAGLAGSMQESFQANHEYVGPCPAGKLHEYQFSVFALGSPTLPNINTGATPMQVYNQAVKLATARATLTGTSNAK